MSHDAEGIVALLVVAAIAAIWWIKDNLGTFVAFAIIGVRILFYLAVIVIGFVAVALIF